MADKAAAEFADTEKMIDTAEALYGPYRWGRYDMLVLPPSFPFGGMENPRLTFVTPTMIAGDQSLVVADRARTGAQLVGQPGHQSPPGRTAGSTRASPPTSSARITEARVRHGQADMENVIGRDELKAGFKELEPKLQLLALEPA